MQSCANIVGLMKEGAEREDFGLVLDLVRDTAVTECPHWKKNNCHYLDMIDQLLKDDTQKQSIKGQQDHIRQIIMSLLKDKQFI